MNRSLERRSFATTGPRRGEVTVGRFDHPTRGPVHSPAAPLIAAALRRRGFHTTESQPRTGIAPESSTGTLFAASYLDDAGHAVGFGAAAHADDPAAMHAAQEVVREWSAVLRTRRALVAATDAVCAGAHRAQQLRDWEGRSGQPVYVVKDPVEERDDTDPAGVITVESLEQIPRGGTVFFPAHGVSRAHAVATRARGTDLIDATCPLVASMQQDVRAFAARGDAVVVIGDRDGAAVAALAGQAPESVTVVESVADVAALHLNQDRVSFVIGGGLPVETATPVLDALRAKYPRLRGQHPDSLCYAASDRAETLRTVAAASDVTLVLGALSQRRATQMARLVTAHGSDIHLIAGISEIRPEWLAGAATVGITATPSADSCAQEETIDALSGLGPLSVVRRRVVTDVLKPNHHG